ncbi:ABC transporter permease [Saccharothrix variisporea]|uniref:ABC-2 type transport system permease protein n=1 Tax=Saccharothrix variisporea TaxID=543527 RepID=A0A495XCN9_9PSEU|nr:ABC transporter permease [Saccharothrix variisporea]RKT69308.1 ABC-2 type transport system permease protein [Saccharothrix variisporea]
MIRDNARVLRGALISALADFRAIYTWWTWGFAWLTRIIVQVAFFAIIGRLLDSPERTRFLLVGNAVFIAVLVSMLVCASTSWERQTGTLPLLIASASHPFVVFAGRSAQWIVDGTVCASVSLFVLGPLFGLGVPLSRMLAAIPVILLISVSAYCFGLALAGLVLRKMELRNLVGNLASLSLMVFCGVQVPTSFWPEPVQVVASVLPLTHGLHAVRDLFAGAPVGAILGSVGLEMCVLVGWLLIASLTFRWLAESGRADGSIEYGE